MLHKKLTAPANNVLANVLRGVGAKASFSNETPDNEHGEGVIQAQDALILSLKKIISIDDEIIKLNRLGHEKGRPGAPSKFSKGILEEAQRMKEAGRTNNVIARRLYGVNSPSPNQRRSVPTILKYHKKRGLLRPAGSDS